LKLVYFLKLFILYKPPHNLYLDHKVADASLAVLSKILHFIIKIEIVLWIEMNQNPNPIQEDPNVLPEPNPNPS